MRPAPARLTGVNLTATELAALAALADASRLPAEYPGWMLARQGEPRRDQLAQARRGEGSAA